MLSYSKAVQLGIRECKTEYISFIGVDGHWDPSEMGSLFEPRLDSSIFTGFRNLRVNDVSRIIYLRLFE